MRIYSLFLMLLILPISSLAKEVPVYQNDVEIWESSMLDYVEDWRNFIGKTREDIESIRVELDKIIVLNPSRPKLRISMGGLYSAEAGLIVSELKEKGISREQRGKDVDYINAIEKLNENYQTALDLDDGGLLLEDFQLINGVAANSDIRVKSLRKMLKLWGEGKRFKSSDDEHDQDEWFEYKTYSHIVTAYIDEKRYTEALSVIDEIKQKFPSMQLEIDTGRQRILTSQQAEEIAKAEPEKTVQPIGPKKPESVTVSTQPLLAQQSPMVIEAGNRAQQAAISEKYSNNLAFIIGVVMVVLVLVGFLVVRRKGK